MHRHKLKEETFFCRTGKLLVVHSEEDCVVDGKVAIESYCPPKYLSRERHWLDATLDGVPTATMTVLEPGDVFHVPIGLHHAMLGLLDTELFEFSTEHFDSDSIRTLKGD